MLVDIRRSIHETIERTPLDRVEYEFEDFTYLGKRQAGIVSFVKRRDGFIGVELIVEGHISGCTAVITKDGEMVFRSENKDIGLVKPGKFRLKGSVLSQPIYTVTWYNETYKGFIVSLGNKQVRLCLYNSSNELISISKIYRDPTMIKDGRCMYVKNKKDYLAALAFTMFFECTRYKKWDTLGPAGEYEELPVKDTQALLQFYDDRYIDVMIDRELRTNPNPNNEEDAIDKLRREAAAIFD